MHRAAILALTFAAAAAGPSCFVDPGFCTLIGAEDGLRLEVVMAAPLPVGSYTFVISAEGRVVRQDFEVAGDGARCADPCRSETDLGDGRTLVVEPIIADDGGWLTIGIPGEGGPALVEVELLRGTTPVASDTYEPEYNTYRPNGRGCEPEVEQARGTFAIPALP